MLCAIEFQICNNIYCYGCGNLQYTIKVPSSVMLVSFCSVRSPPLFRGNSSCVHWLRLFEIAVFLFYRYFGANTQQQPSPQPPPPSSPLCALTNAVLHGPRGDDFRGKSHPRKHAGLPQQRLLQGLHGLFPPESPAYFLPHSDSRLFSPHSGWGRCDPSRGSKVRKGGGLFLGE